jgi:hypothetical protein
MVDRSEFVASFSLFDQFVDLEDADLVQPMRSNAVFKTSVILWH